MEVPEAVMGVPAEGPATTGAKDAREAGAQKVRILIAVAVHQMMLAQETGVG